MPCDKHADAAKMTIERIYTKAVAGGPAIEHKRVRIVAGSGIPGDRYYGKREEPGQNITFVEAEEIEAFLNEHNRPLDLSVTGRNVVTRGVRLNELVGRAFIVGGLRFHGVERCEPCLVLGKALQSSQLPSAHVVKRLLHRMGLRADALASGELAVGAKFVRERSSD